MKEHAVNPVLYVEYEDITGADKIFKEVVGFDSFRDLLEPAEDLRQEKKREVEAKLILSSNVRGWNVAGNLIAEKNLSGEPIEFGYAAAVSRPLALAASPSPCSLCPENFLSRRDLRRPRRTTSGHSGRHVSLHRPVCRLEPSEWPDLPPKPSFGINANSNRALVRLASPTSSPVFFKDECTMNIRKHLAIALLTCLAGCATGPQTTSAPFIAERSSNDVPAGRKLYAQHCAACHGLDAQGSTRAPSLQTASVQSMPDPALVQFLTDGNLRKGMPSWSRLPIERRWQLARFVKSFRLQARQVPIRTRR